MTGGDTVVYIMIAIPTLIIALAGFIMIWTTKRQTKAVDELKVCIEQNEEHIVTNEKDIRELKTALKAHVTNSNNSILKLESLVEKIADSEKQTSLAVAALTGYKNGTAKKNGG